MTVLDVGMLIPGGSITPGSRVVKVSTGAAGEQMTGLVGTVMSQPEKGAVSVRFEQHGGSGEEGAATVKLAQLLLIPDANESKRHDKAGMDTRPKQFVVDDWAVLTGLSKRPELNGRICVVREAASDAGAAGDAPRCVVQLLAWEKLSPRGGEAVSDSTIRAQRRNLIRVAEPPPAVIVAFASHNVSEVASTKRFVESEWSKLKKGWMNIKCTLHEVLMMQRVLTEAADAVDSGGRQISSDGAGLSKANRARLLGDLDPKHWRIAVITPTEPPLPPETLLDRELKGKLQCRCCGAAGVKLMKCTQCM